MIYTDIQKAKLQKNANRTVLSLLMSEICVDGKPMDDDKAIATLVSMKKNAQKTIDMIATSDSVDTVKSNEYIDFIEVIDSFLPKAATPEDVEMELAILDLPRTMKSMGPLMKSLKSKYPVVDGNLVKGILTS